jgi:ribosome-associated protein
MKDKITLTSQERAIKCALFAMDKKALDIKILEIGRLSSIADYLVLASGRSDKQTQAIADSIKQGLKPFAKVLDVEGLREGNWIVIDYGDVIVHVFQERVRHYYDLEELWSAALPLEFPQEDRGEGGAG